MMLDANAWAFLNIRHPVCAWAAYRGFLLPVAAQEGFVSAWTSGHLRAQNYEWLAIETGLEAVRQSRFPNQISRLTGIYVFPDPVSAERAAYEWGRNFNPSFFSELHIRGGLDCLNLLDANWISNAKKQHVPEGWQEKYWSGEACPNGKPIWETIINRPAAVLRTPLREQAFQILAKYAPKAVAILEIGRLAAAVDSSLGNISCHLQRMDGNVIGTHHLDMRDAKEPTFIERLNRLLASGHPVNSAATSVGTEDGVFAVPDLRFLDFSVPESRLFQA